MLINMKPYVSLPFSAEHTPYTLGITTPETSIDQKRNVIELLPGHQTSVSVIPQLVSTEDSFDSMSLISRDCKFSYETDELPLNIIKGYTRVGCELECAAKKAIVLCKCMPWYYANNDSHSICDMFGGYCFEKIMSTEKYYKMCPDICKQDCKGTSYIPVISYIKINSDDFCKEGSFMDQLFKKSAKQIYSFEHYKLLANGGDVLDIVSSNDEILYDNDLQIVKGLKNTDKILQNLEEFLQNLIKEVGLETETLENMNEENKEWRKSLKTEEILQNQIDNDNKIRLENMDGENKEWRKSMCKTFVEKYVAFVSVESPTNTVAHTVQDIRDGLIEKLGIIGGTIGLFTGFSLLSLLEIIFVSINLYNKCFKNNVIDVDEKESDPRESEDSSHHECKAQIQDIQDRLTILENVCNVYMQAL